MQYDLVLPVFGAKVMGVDSLLSFYSWEGSDASFVLFRDMLGHLGLALATFPGSKSSHLWCSHLEDNQ